MTARPANIWLRYRTGTWHAWRPGERRSVCGFAMRRPSGEPKRSPEGHGCQHCKAKLRKGGQYRASEPSHRTDVPCACDRCRATRKVEAEEYASDVMDGLPGCRCVRSWDGASEYIAAPFARWAGLLLVWERTGDRVTRRDVEEAAAALREAWREAAEAYEIIDGSHPHARGKR